MTWRLMNGNKVVAVAKKEGNTVYLEALPNVTKFELPIDLFKLGNRKVTMLEFIEWASDRCFPENRVDAKEQLEDLGLDHYDGWEIVKIKRAKLETDPFWIAG